MFCHYCGAKLPDGSRICTSCGASLTAPSSAAPQAEPQYAPAQKQYGGFDPRRTAARSPLFVLGAIMVALLMLAALISASRTYVGFFDRGLRSTTVYSFLMTIFSETIATLTTVAVWLSFGLSKSRRDPLPVGGALTLASVAVIMRIVYTFIAIGWDLYDIINSHFFRHARGKSWAYFFVNAADYLIFTVTLIVVLVSIVAIKKRGSGSAVTISGMMCIAYAAYSVARELFFILDGMLSHAIFWTYLSFFSVVLNALAMLFFGLLLLRYAKLARS